MSDAPSLGEVISWSGLACATAVEISVLIPCWHAELTIGGALDSVEAQQGLPDQFGIEVVIVVDGRQEDRQAVYRWIESKGSVRRCAITMVCLQQNCGAGSARKVGYSYCTGAFLALLDDDDVWHPRKLFIQWWWHHKNPSAIASAHGYETYVKEHNVTFPLLMIGGYILPTPTLMIRRALWPYEPEPYRFGEDWLMLAMIASIQPIHVLTQNLAWRSPKAPPLLCDVYSLSRQRYKLRVGKIRSIVVLCQRGTLSPIWIPAFWGWNLLLFIRRWLLDCWCTTRLGAAKSK